MIMKKLLKEHGWEYLHGSFYRNDRMLEPDYRGDFKDNDAALVLFEDEWLVWDSSEYDFNDLARVAKKRPFLPISMIQNIIESVLYSLYNAQYLPHEINIDNIKQEGNILKDNVLFFKWDLSWLKSEMDLFLCKREDKIIKFNYFHIKPYTIFIESDNNQFDDIQKTLEYSLRSYLSILYYKTREQLLRKGVYL